MSSVADIRAVEKRLRHILQALDHADTRELDRLSAELRDAGDDYTRAIRELEFERPDGVAL